MRRDTRLLIAALTVLFVSIGFRTVSSSWPSYDRSRHLFALENETTPLPAAAAWDAVWFHSIALKGYENDQEMAFWRLFPTLLRYIPYFGCFILCLPVLTASFRVFAEVTGHSASLLEALFAVLLTPATPFLIAHYTEMPTYTLSVLTAASFACDNFLLMVLVVAAAVPLRSNNVALIGYVVLAALQSRRWPRLLLTGVLVPCLFLLSAYAGPMPAMLCPGASYCDAHPVLRPFALYSFIQEKYWDVGPWRYWKFTNVHMFVLALPATVVLLRAASAVLKQCATRQPAHYDRFMENAIPVISQPVASLKNLLKAVFLPTASDKRLPAAVLSVLLLMAIWRGAHVQIVNRVVVCATPLYALAMLESGRPSSLLAVSAALFCGLGAALFPAQGWLPWA